MNNVAEKEAVMAKNKSNEKINKDNKFIDSVFTLTTIMERLELVLQQLTMDSTSESNRAKLEVVENGWLQHPHIKISVVYFTADDDKPHGVIGVNIHKTYIEVFCDWYHFQQRIDKLSNNTQHNLKNWLENLLPGVEIRTQCDKE